MIFDFLLEMIKEIQHPSLIFANAAFFVYERSVKSFQFVIPSYNFNIDDSLRTIEDESVVSLRRRLNSSRRSRPQINETQMKGDGAEEETGLLYAIVITNIHRIRRRYALGRWR